MISQLISDLYSYFLTEHDIASGFDELLATLDDLHLDTPDAPSVRVDILGRRCWIRLQDMYGNKIGRLTR